MFVVIVIVTPARMVTVPHDVEKEETREREKKKGSARTEWMITETTGASAFHGSFKLVRVNFLARWII